MVSFTGIPEFEGEKGCWNVLSQAIDLFHDVKVWTFMLATIVYQFTDTIISNIIYWKLIT